MNILYRKFKEVFLAILPIVSMVLFLELFLIDLAEGLLPRFLMGALMIFLGLSIFLFGVENGITPIGNELGTRLTRSGSLPLVLGAGAALGFIISMAEPDLHILADQEFDPVRIIIADDVFHQADLVVFTAQAQNQDGAGIGIVNQAT